MIVNSQQNLCILFVSFLLFSNVIFSQNVDFKNANFKQNKQDLKLAKDNISIADNLRDVGIENILAMKDGEISLIKAIFYYKKAQFFNPNNSDLNYKIGSCYLFTNQKEKAAYYLTRASELSDDLPFDFLFFSAMVSQLQSDYFKAGEQFDQFRLLVKNKVYQRYELLAKKYTKECLEANNILSNYTRVWVDNISINTEFDDWGPCLSADGEFLIFTSNQPNENQPNEFGVYDQNIYSSSLTSRKFKSATPISELNTENDEVSGGLSYDGQRLLIFKNENGNTDIFESKLNGLKWDLPSRKMGAELRGGNTVGNETFASFDPPDVKVYYITDGGYSGNKNIYFSGIMNKERNLWGKGQSAGHEINTKYQEGSVYIHPDGKTMYFSSQGHNSLGGYDIFVSYVDDLGHWGEPINLGYPINTSYDDLFYSATASGRHAYIASNRAGGIGGLDIYKLTYWGANKPMEIDVHDQLIAGISKPVSENSISKPIIVEEKSLTVFKGKVLDAITKEPIKAEIEIILNETGKVYTSFFSNSATGKFLLSLPSGNNYGISVTAEGYLFHSENFDLPKGDCFNNVSRDVELKNIKVGSNITLRNVFFNTGKWQVKDDSYSELSRLVLLLNEIPSLKIEISGHTDNLGAEYFNELLSQRRADAIVSYLVGNGIDEKRLSSKGYGQSNPIESNNTAMGRASNRRTEFKIIEN